MNSNFANAMASLHPLFLQLTQSSRVEIAKFKTKPKRAGVYLFSEPQNGPLYIGRSNNIRGRYGRHCNPGATHRNVSAVHSRPRQACSVPLLFLGCHLSSETTSNLTLCSFNRIDDHLLGLASVAPSSDLHPFIVFEVFIMLEEMLDLMQRDGG